VRQFFDATVAYQGFGRGLNIESLLEICLMATHRIAPDLTFLLDLPPEVSAARVRARGDADRLEREDLEFHTRVREGYLTLASRFANRYVVLDATQTPEIVASAARAELHHRMNPPPLLIDGTFDVIGAAGPRSFFERLTAATLSHGYLFTGPAGRGKKDVRARAGALAALRHAQRTLLGWCGICSGCTQFEAGTHRTSTMQKGSSRSASAKAAGISRFRGDDRARPGSAAVAALVRGW